MTQLFLNEPVLHVVQIVGLKGGLHTSVALSNVSPHIHGVRLGQTSEVEVQFEMQTGKWPCVAAYAQPFCACPVNGCGP